MNRFEEELQEKARAFLKAAEENAESRAFLEQYGFSAGEQERGRVLLGNVERSFAWEREGTAWNFLSPTVERRLEEARDWYDDRRRRWKTDCYRAFEASWSPRDLLRAFSLSARARHRAELRRDLLRARGEKPAGAPPPKDSALVELAGWYEHWRLLAQRVFRGRPELMTPYGLTPGKAPPRLRSRAAKLKYGEGAAGTADAPAPARRVLPVVE